MEFEKCPRCGGEWKECTFIAHEDHQCKSCEPCKGHLNELGFAIRIGSYGVRWFIRRMDKSLREPITPTKTVHLMKLAPRIDNPSIYDTVGDEIEIAAWLPFDITEERLKLLLVFS